ncbi:hypothetical protein WICMUC_003861 [Wickerhamomyces mucosus]|uniref:Major facilitator superfamily (MFS) profile domain-containing protein n=1 Tax=Wickerhamomyces mucosus TaxID=1378264 RepID=A0A9P8PIY0_9ASCO|nr:hypothetical protein WICMUC_003861 [Wickerhamomyces mucosus]
MAKTEIEADAEKHNYIVNADSLSLSSRSSEEYVETPVHTWKGRIWDAWDKPKEEAWFLFKLDASLLFILSSGVFLRYLDQSNITSSYTSGMKEDLSLYGNELNYANVLFSIGYAIGQIPSNLLLSKMSHPHYYIAAIEIIWSVLTFCTASVKTAKGMYGIRFFLGLVESGHFPAAMYVTSSWYTKKELSKRVSIITFNTQTGPLVGYLLQAATYSGLNGVHGRAGWRWMFIIDGVLSLPMALLVLFTLPDIPRTQKPNWIFSQKEIELARKRVPIEAKIHATFKWKDIKSWLCTWQVYFFSTLFILQALSGLSSSSINYWFKSFNTSTYTRFTIPQINHYSSVPYAIAIVVMVAYGYLSDNILGGRRYIIVAFTALIGAIISLALALTPVHATNIHVRWALFYLYPLAISAGQQWTWVNEASLGEPSKRAFVGASMNAFCNAFNGFIPIFAYPTYKQPFVKGGNIMSACCGLGAFFFALAGGYIQHRGAREGFFRVIPLSSEVEDESELQAQSKSDNTDYIDLEADENENKVENKG